jgi:hypothetical protein
MRKLPIFNMSGTDFYVDIRCNEFREHDAPWNRISLDEMWASVDEGTEIAFDRNTKNLYDGIIEADKIPSHVTLVLIPPLKELDPVGVARKLNLPDNWFLKKIPEHVKQKRKGRRI